jgi:hypothetical protein
LAQEQSENNDSDVSCRSNSQTVPHKFNTQTSSHKLNTQTVSHKSKTQIENSNSKIEKDDSCDLLKSVATSVKDLTACFKDLKTNQEHKIDTLAKRQEDLEVSGHHVTFKGEDKSEYHWDDLGTTLRPSYASQNHILEAPLPIRKSDLTSTQACYNANATDFTLPQTGYASNVTVRNREPSSIYLPPHRRSQNKAANVTYTRNSSTPEQENRVSLEPVVIRKENANNPSPRMTSTALRSNSTRYDQYSSDDSFVAPKNQEHTRQSMNNSRSNFNYRPPKPKVGEFSGTHWN